MIVAAIVNDLVREDSELELGEFDWGVAINMLTKTMANATAFD